MEQRITEVDELRKASYLSLMGRKGQETEGSGKGDEVAEMVYSKASSTEYWISGDIQ